MTTEVSSRHGPAFRHEALLYSSPQEFLDGTLPFIRDGRAAGEPVLAVLGADKLELLRSELGGEPEGVCLADMAEVGHNPARIIPAWREFVGENSAGGRPVRGVGEPIHPARRPAELAECHRHECLLNLAFEDAAGFWLLCPYDTSALPAAVLEEAERNHPLISESGRSRPSDRYGGLERASAPFSEPLPEPGSRPHECVFDGESLPAVRTFVSIVARDEGLSPERADDLVLAVNEVAANSVVHAGGSGRLLAWREDRALICEVRDRGRIDIPLAGRVAPGPEQLGGCGLWIANQVCDLVQIRSTEGGSAVRLHTHLG